MKNNFNQMGVSLLQVLMIAAALSGLSLAGSKVITGQKIGSTTEKSKNRIDQLNETIKVVLADKKHCSQTLTLPNNTKAGTVKSIVENLGPNKSIPFTSITNSEGTVLFTTNPTGSPSGVTYLNNTIAIKSMNLVTGSGTPPTSADIEIRYERYLAADGGKRPGVGGKEIVKKIPIKIDVGLGGTSTDGQEVDMGTWTAVPNSVLVFKEIEGRKWLMQTTPGRDYYITRGKNWPVDDPRVIQWQNMDANLLSNEVTAMGGLKPSSNPSNTYPALFPTTWWAKMGYIQNGIGEWVRDPANPPAIILGDEYPLGTLTRTNGYQDYTVNILAKYFDFGEGVNGYFLTETAQANASTNSAVFQIRGTNQAFNGSVDDRTAYWQSRAAASGVTLRESYTAWYGTTQPSDIPATVTGLIAHRAPDGAKYWTVAVTSGVTSCSASGSDQVKDFCEQFGSNGQSFLSWDSVAGTCVPKTQSCSGNTFFVGFDNEGQKICKKFDGWIDFNNIVDTSEISDCAGSSEVSLEIVNNKIIPKCKAPNPVLPELRPSRKFQPSLPKKL